MPAASVKSRRRWLLLVGSGAVVKKDRFLGDQEIYRDTVQISLPLAREAGAGEVHLAATYKGCDKRIRLCDSPIEMTFDFQLP